MEIREITREDEAKLPNFNSHRDARVFFEARYCDAFQIEDSFIVGEGDDATICYRYVLILNREAYEKGLRQLAQGSMGDAGASEFLSSYQPIEIMLDGNVRVIH